MNMRDLGHRLIATPLLAFISLSVHAETGSNWMPGGMNMNHGMWGGGPWVMIVFWGTAIIFLAWLIHSLWPSKNRRTDIPNHNTNPVEILKSRYARGEINKEEYIEKLEILDGSKTHKDNS